MKCQYCQMNDETVNMTMQINNRRMQMHLCNDCFQELQGKMANPENFFSGENANDAFSNGFFQAGGQGQTGTRTKQKTNKGNGLLDQLGKKVKDDTRAGLVYSYLSSDIEL